MLTALPAPAVGGTCGPSTASETALEALAEPGSIGAGPQPPASNTAAHHQWQTFIDQCQSLADRRGLASLAIVVISLAVSAIGLIWVLRRPKSDDSGETVDGSSEWSPEHGPDDPSELVGAGVAIAPPAAAVGAWSDAPPAGYGVAPYAPQQAWPPQAPAAAPYPYGQPGPYGQPHPYGQPGPYGQPYPYGQPGQPHAAPPHPYAGPVAHPPQDTYAPPPPPAYPHADQPAHPFTPPPASPSAEPPAVPSADEAAPPVGQDPMAPPTAPHPDGTPPD